MTINPTISTNYRKASYVPTLDEILEQYKSPEYLEFREENFTDEGEYIGHTLPKGVDEDRCRKYLESFKALKSRMALDSDTLLDVDHTGHIVETARNRKNWTNPENWEIEENTEEAEELAILAEMGY